MVDCEGGVSWFWHSEAHGSVIEERNGLRTEKHLVR